MTHKIPYPLLTTTPYFVKVMSMMKVRGTNIGKAIRVYKRAAHRVDGDAAKKPLGGLHIERLGSFNHGGTDGSRHGRSAGKRHQGRRGFVATARKESDPTLRFR